MYDTDQITWTDGIDSCRCRVPTSIAAFARIPATLGILFGLFAASGPCLMSAFVYFVMPMEARRDDMFIWFALSPLVFAGIFAFPVAAFAIRWSVLMLFGRTQIALDTSTLRVITSVGPVWSTRRCKLSQLGGFRIINASLPGSPPGFSAQSERSSLVAVRKGGREVFLLRAYPNAIVQQLAEELPRRIERITGRVVQPGSESIRATDLGAETVAASPTEVLERTDKPIGSKLILEEQGDELMIRIPRPGFRNSTSKIVALWSFAFLLMQLILSVFLVPALIAGKVGGQPAAGWFIFAVFTALAIGIVLYRLSAAVRTGSIRLNDQRLQLVESGLFGTQRAEWSLASLEDVRIGVERYESEDGTS